MRDIGDVGSETLAKPDDHLPLLRHVLRAKPRASAVAPHGPPQRRQPGSALHTGNALQVVPQLLFLEGQLGLRSKMLQSTSAADAKMRTARLHPLRRRPQHLQQPALIVLSM